MSTPKFVSFITFIVLAISLLLYALSGDNTSITNNPQITELKNPMSAVRLYSVSKPASAAVIFFHGLGDTGNGWRFFGEMARQSSDFDHINFVFPNAPVIPVTANGGHQMPAWFDILQFGGDSSKQDTVGYLNALETVEKYVEEQNQLGIKSERVIIGGFSQGGGITLGSLVKTEKKLGGVLAFSPSVRLYDTLRQIKKDANLNTPIFHGHGDADPMIKITASNATAKFFTEDLGFKDYVYTVYQGLTHSAAKEEIDYAFGFIKRILPSA